MKTIEERDNLIREKDTALREKEAALNAVSTSMGRRIRSYYYRLRERVPLLYYLHKSLTVLLREGATALLTKGFTKVRRDMRLSWGAARFLWGRPPVTTCSSKPDIIVFPVIDWDFRYQRPQHIASRFAKAGYRVLYLTVGFTTGSAYKRRTIKENIYEIMLPLRESRSIYNLTNQDALGSLTPVFRQIWDDFRIRESVAIVQLPLWWPLAQRLKGAHGSKIVYDCLDEFSGFSDVARRAQIMEDALLRDADYCITTSTRLYEKNTDRCRRIGLVRNGTEFEHFHNLPQNSLLRGIPRPIIGYYGAIAEWFDVETVEYVATQRPEWSIVLIGHTIGCDIGRLKKFPNIHILGEKPYRHLPKYLYWFDVCIIPFNLTDLILSTNPVKFYEFISSGKPVVASAIPELLQYAEYLYISQARDDFLQNIEKALDEDISVMRGKRIELARANDWDSRFEQITTCIKEAYPRVSIIIVTFNNLAYTKLCIESIYAKTAYPNFELVCVDNASSDGTVDHLNALKAERKNVKIILNPQNVGFAAANNLGINEASGEYLILLNNDTIVTRGWIGGLIGHLHDRHVGMVGPVTNWIGNEARIDVSYKHISEIETFAEEYTQRNRGVAFEIPVLAFYCAAMRRETVEKVGPLDEQFGIGMFEDDDYAQRLKSAGFKLLCAEDVFIHHFGGVSFGRLSGQERGRNFEENKVRFEAKWGMAWVPHKYRK